MTHLASTSPGTPLALRRLIALRWVLLAGELSAILLAPSVLDVPLPQWSMLTVVALQCAANVRTAIRVARSLPCVDGDLFVQLLIDVGALSVLMFLSGGAANPLVSLLLPPVAIAALALPGVLVTVVAGLAVAAYSLLNFVYLPLPIADVSRATQLHLAGMWFTFVVSVGMLAWFLVRMTASIRQRDLELAAAREKALRDERVVALGALAAGAAHELSTPLATMAIVAGELEQEAVLDDDARADVAVLRQQIDACKQIIGAMAERAGAGRLESAQAVSAERWLGAVHARWRALRPHATSELHFAGAGRAPTLIADAALEQALISLFNNAADTGSAVHVRADWDAAWLSMEIRDGGPGFSPQVLAQAGREPLPAHAGGSGIGLLLAHEAVERLEGELTLFNDAGGVARVRLPVRSDH